MSDDFLGVDIAIENGDFVTAPTGDVQLVTGKACVGQDVRHRISSPKDALFLHPGWGGHLIRFTQMANTKLNQLDLQQAICECLENEVRVVAGSAKASIISWDRQSIQADASFLPIGETNPLNLVISLDSTGIKIEVI